jgi:CDP-diacylglycerol--serine O-phosphatidyltransferase
VIAATHLSGLATPAVLLALLAVFTYLMVAPITYPDLYARDAVVLGGLQALAIAFPTAAGRVLPRSLLVFAVGYLLLSPFLYWRRADGE